MELNTMKIQKCILMLLKIKYIALAPTAKMLRLVYKEKRSQLTLRP